MLKKQIKVRVPATSGNLGSGFDALGIALNLYNTIELFCEKKIGKDQNHKHLLTIEIKGEGKGSLPEDESNVVWQGIQKVLKKKGFPIQSFSFYLKLENKIPLAKGLGSSAGARVGGILAGSGLLNNSLSQMEILNLAAAMEGHPDNAAPAVMGGLVASCLVEGEVQAIRLNPPRELCAVVCLPEFELSTEKARKILPSHVSREDAVFNLQRTALFLASFFTKNFSCLKEAMQDRLHQNYRKKLIPGFDQVVKNGYDQGALGVALSGAGPSLLAFAYPKNAKKVGEAMEKGFLKYGKKASSFILNFDFKGAQNLC
ncbi:MAG: homoserine kinase [Elusimicrobia bacterium]|nr:homoserine kinase [Elusimicrobiota bacterium]